MSQKRYNPQNADEVILDCLAYEFEYDNPKKTERQIKRKLRYHNLGPYQQERVDYLRKFKSDVQAEISKLEKSRFFTEHHDARFADMRDFDHESMNKHYSALYPDIPKATISNFINFAIYLYYLR